MSLQNMTKKQVRAYQRRMDMTRGNQELWNKTRWGFQRAHKLNNQDAELIAVRGWGYVQTLLTE